MLVLLPPSESKAAPPRRGRPVDLEALSFPVLTAHRRRVIEALVAASAQPDALTHLDVGASLSHEVARNTRVGELPAVPAWALYTGVLYDALGWSTLDAGARRRGLRRVVVMSALWGALRPADRVPAYRLSMGTDLRGVGPLAAAWRPLVGPVLAEAAGPAGLIVDCRSSTYAAAGPVTGPAAQRTVTVRVLREEAGRRTVVSHMAKHTRGEVTRHLLEAGSDPRSPAALADSLAARWPVELTAPPHPGRSWTLDVVLRA